VAVMVAKVLTLTFVVIWIRWSLPRFRVDQMMSLCWKWLLPGAFACFVASAAWTWATASAPRLDTATRWLMFLTGGVALTTSFIVRVVSAFRRVKLLHVGDRQFSWPIFERRLDKR
jgi:NADH-quinone oxidoreductase subunit H